MDVIYSPTTHSLALIPRFSSSSSQPLSSSSSICLCLSRIQTIRSTFFGSKLRLDSTPKCKRVVHSQLPVVSSLTPFPVVAVVVAATAIAMSTLTLFFSNSNKNKNKQKGKDALEVGFYSPVDAAHLHIESLKEINYSSLEVKESISKDNEDAVDLSWKGSSSISEDTLTVQQADFSDSGFQESGAVVSALLEKQDKLGPSLPHAPSQHLQIDNIENDYSILEMNDTDHKDNESKINFSYQDLSVTPKEAPDTEKAEFSDSDFHDLGAIASALSEKSEHIGLSLTVAPPEFLDTESFSLPEVRETMADDGECGVKLSSQNPSSTQDMHEVEELDCTDSDSQDLRVVESEASLHLPKASTDSDAQQPHLQFTEELEFVNSGAGADLNLSLHVQVDDTKGSESAFVDTAFKDSNHEGADHDHEYKFQSSNQHQSTAIDRDELHSFYEHTLESDNQVHSQGINGSSIEDSYLTKNYIHVTKRDSASEILQDDKFQVAGNGGVGPVAFDAGGSSDEGKDLRRGRRRLRSDTKGLSLRDDHQDASDLPAAGEALRADRENSISRHMSSYNRLLRSSRLSECVQLLEDMDGKGILDMNKIYHTKFFDFCRRQKAVREAFRFAKLISNPTLSTFNMLMSVCSASQNSEGAFEVWHLVQKAGFKADCRLYTTLISTCAKSGKVDTMFEVFHEMVNAGVEPNVHTYGALIDGCARAGQVAKAFGVYGILRSKNVKPDRVVFNALITACGQSGAVERAFDVLAEMRSELQPIDPDHITVGALIRACTSAGQVDRVKGVYEMIDQFNIKGTPELYTIAANSCSLDGDWDFACTIYADMKRKGVVPDEMFFSSLIDVAGHSGKLDAAFKVLQDARTEGMNPGIITYSSLMGACSNTQNWEKALQLFEQIKALKFNPTVSTVNALITALCDANQMQKALDILAEMQKLGLRPNDITYSILIAASEKNDDLEVGLNLYSQAKAGGVSFSQIMCKCLIKMCSRRFEKASTIGEPILSFKAGRPQIDNKWTSLALMIYREMIGAGLVPSVEMISQVLGCLQLPKDVSLKKRVIETLGINVEASKNTNLLSLVDGFAEYDPRAFSLFEEAASLGIVPGASFKESPIIIDLRNLNIHIAEVYILTVLKGLKHRLAAGAKVPSVNISLPVETTYFSCLEGEKTINVSARLSQAVGALLRRIRLPYQGSESSGKIRISGYAIKKWLQPKLASSFRGNQAHSYTQLGLSHLTLAKRITNQQRKIRSGDFSLD